MRLGFLSDAHGNLEALDQGIAILNAAKCQRIYFLGDAVGYLPGDAVVGRIIDAQIESLRGNHEDMVIRNAIPATSDAVYRLKKTKAEMLSRNLSAITDWPLERRIDAPGGQLLLVHGSPRDPLNGYVYPDTPVEELVAEGVKATFCGHTHRPFVARRNDALFVNVGSVGLPRDDGRFGSVAWYDTDSGEVEVLRFDITTATARAVIRCGPVHQSVTNLLNRRAESVFGKFV